MKKIILLIYVLLLTLLASPVQKFNNVTVSKKMDHTNLSAGFEEDEKIPITITRTNITEITIKHDFRYIITDAVVEYVLNENGTASSYLNTFPVKNDKVALDTNGITAVRIHQLLVVYENVTYRYSTTGEISAPGNYNWGNVVRHEWTEIKTVAAKNIDTKMSSSNTISNAFIGNVYVYEFYFNFNDKHDYIDWVDVRYVFNRFYNGIPTGSETVEERRSNKQEYTTHGYEEIIAFGVISYLPASYDYIGLEENKTSTAGAYVVRVSPSNKKFFDNMYTVENFAIIRIRYILDGEFILKDVVNVPITPDRPDDINWLLELIERIREIFTKLFDFFKTNMGTLGMILKVIVGVIIVVTTIFIIKTLASLFKVLLGGLKFIFSLPGRLLKVLKYLFIPPKKKKKKYNRRN